MGCSPSKDHNKLNVTCNFHKGKLFKMVYEIEKNKFYCHECTVEKYAIKNEEVPWETQFLEEEKFREHRLEMWNLL